MTPYRFYLAGPEVFWPEPLRIAEAKKEICRRSQCQGLFPLDTELDLAGLSKPEAGRRIAAANEDLMRSADALIANMSPFRGPGMDGGTAYEMGFMRGLGKPIFGYTTDLRDYFPRACAFGPTQTRRKGFAAGALEDAQRWLIEDFALADNLMMAAATGQDVVRNHDDLSAFERCVQQAIEFLNTKAQDS